MKLTQIGIHIPKSEKITLVDGARAATVTTAMYGYYLKDYQTDGVKRVSISLTTDQSKQNLILPLESVLMYSKIFVDGEKYNSSDEYNRKLISLNIIRESLLYIAEKRNWEIQPLIDAYDACIERNLEFKAIYKNKYYQSPNRRHFATLYYDWGVEKYEAFAIFYNKRKEEIQRKKILECDPAFVQDFTYVGWDKEQPNHFVILQKYPDRRYAAELNVT